MPRRLTPLFNKRVIPLNLLSTPARLYSVALAAGAVLPLAFAPFDFVPLAFISLALLFLVWQRCSPALALRTGYFFGVGQFAVGVSWVFVSMHDFGGVSIGLGVFLTTLFVLFLALFPATVGWVFVRYFLPRRRVLATLLVLPALWTLAEWCRGWIFTGFPWLAVGYSQVDSPLAGLAPIVGVYGISFAAGLVAAGFVLMVSDWRTHLKWVAPMVVIIIGASAVLSSRVWSEPAGLPLRVSLLQGNVSQDLKWLPEQRQPTIDAYISMTRAHWDSNLIIWPETALPVFKHQASELLEQLGSEARDKGAEVFIGMPVMNMLTKRYYNSMVSIGGVEQVYSKQHLVPFGEYIPLAGVIGRIMEIIQVPLPDFSVEYSAPTVVLAGYRMGVSICYEDAFGEEIIRALPEAAVLINVSNDAWFGDSFAPHQHLQMARMRTLETRRPMLRSTNTGVTAIIDHFGRIAARAPQFVAIALTAEVVPMRGSTPYSRLGNLPILVVILVIVFGGMALQWRDRKEI